MSVAASFRRFRPFTNVSSLNKSSSNNPPFFTRLSNSFSQLGHAFLVAISRLDKSCSPNQTIATFRAHQFTVTDILVYIFQFCLATFWIFIMSVPPFPYKLAIPILYAIALLLPITSQFFVPATPIFAYLLSFYSSRFIPTEWRPDISVGLLPTLESVLYGANVSDILTRFTHPILDVFAWIPYGVGHFTLPFVVAAFVWLFRTKHVLHYWGSVFGWMNLMGVLAQIVFPCSAPWYELIHGLTPAHYGMKGSPGGLARIDALFNSNGYTNTFTNAPLPFGAFPSLHSACATLEALFVSHFFPHMTIPAWTYAGVLYWSTMYLSHHYLIDVVGGACMATAFFYFFMPAELKSGMNITMTPPGLPPNSYMLSKGSGGTVVGGTRNKYEFYDLEDPRRRKGDRNIMLDAAEEFELSEEEEGQAGILRDGHTGDGDADITTPGGYRSTAGIGLDTPTSAIPLIPNHGHTPLPTSTSFSEDVQRIARKPSPNPNGSKHLGKGQSHRHTASIASLIRGEERSAEDGWSPVSATFVLGAPPAKEERRKV